MPDLRETLNALNNPRLIDYLRWRYAGESLLARGGAIYPCAVHRAPHDQREDVESVLGCPLDAHVPAEPLVADDALRRAIAEAGRDLANLPTYTLRELHAGPGQALNITCAMGDYFSMLDTCDALEWEIARHAPELTASDAAALRAFDARLRQRLRVHELVANPARDGRYRSVALAVSCVIAYREQEQWRLMVRRRSPHVAVHAGKLHVIPSFMVQPATAAYAEEFSLQHQIFREYLEEVFDLPESTAASDPRYFYGDARLRFLRGLLAQGKARLYFTGIAMNLFSLRPEICALLRIDSEEWSERHRHHPPTPQDRIALNAEFAQDGGISDIGLAGDEEMQAQAAITPETMVPCGAAAFWLAVDLLRELDEQ